MSAIVHFIIDHALWLAIGLVVAVLGGFALDGLEPFGWAVWIIFWLIVFLGIGRLVKRRPA